MLPVQLMAPDDVPTLPIPGLEEAEEHRIVLADEGSPKRHKSASANATSSAAAVVAVPESFWQQVQEAVSTAVVASMSPIQEAVTNLQTRAQATDVQLKELEGRFNTQAGQLQELDHRMAAHFTSVEEQLQQLQKDIQSPRTSPPVSPVGGSGVQKTCDVVLGGGQLGEAREWIEDQVASLVAKAGVKEHVAEVRPLGNRRPKCVKLLLAHPDGADMTTRRGLQQKVITSMNALRWVPRGGDKPVWVKQDRTIPERHTAKAYAIMYNFVESTLMADKGVIEVESWTGLEVWAGKYRVLGNALGSGMGSPPPRSDEFLVWIVQEPAHGLSVWMDIHGLAQGLSLQPAEVLRKWRGK